MKSIVCSCFIGFLRSMFMCTHHAAAWLFDKSKIAPVLMRRLQWAKGEWGQRLVKHMRAQLERAVTTATAIDPAEQPASAQDGEYYP